MSAHHFNFVHGHSLAPNGKQHRTRTYNSWRAMITRCFDTEHDKFKYYGGRGIIVCDSWLKFDAFLRDMGEAPKGMWLGRLDNDRPYGPDNCEWQTAQKQARTKGNNHLVPFKGRQVTLAEAAELSGIGASTIRRWMANNPHFTGDVSQLYFVPWRNRRKLLWNPVGS